VAHEEFGDRERDPKKNQETTMTEPNKCAHPACKCLVSKDSAYGKYCSEHCKEAADEIELRCECQHPACR
jgi:hypothetical protein